MKSLYSVIGLIALLLALTMGVPSVSWAQQPPSAAAVQPDGSGVLTEEEEHAFNARLRAAPTDEMRAQIEQERDGLIHDRTEQQSMIQIIPPSREEATGNLVMPDVPDPRPNPADNPAESLPGGALDPVDPSSDLLPPGAAPDPVR